eukprot:12919014-Prorocentrum_lima.AAC.1
MFCAQFLGPKFVHIERVKTTTKLSQSTCLAKAPWSMRAAYGFAWIQRGGTVPRDLEQLAFLRD